MTQKRIGDVLYVFSIEPYVITQDINASVIYVQEEYFEAYKELNPNLTNLKKKNYKIACVSHQEWFPFLNEEDVDPTPIPEPVLVSADLEWSTPSYTATINGDNLFPSLYNPHSVVVSYESSDSSIASIDGENGNISLVAAGQVTISAIFEGDSTYRAQTVTYVLTVQAEVVPVEKQDPTFSWSQNSYTATIGQTNYYPTLSNPEGVSIIYDSSDPNIASIDEYGNITLSNSGTVYITATFAGNEQYNARQVSYTMTVESQEEPTPVTPVSPNLSWSDSVGSYDTYTGTRNIPTLNNPNSVSVSYSSSDTSVATVDAIGDYVFLSVGSTTITATFLGDSAYESQSVSYTLTISDSTPQLVNLSATPYPVSNQESTFPVTKSGDFLLINDANFTFDSSKWSASCVDANVSINYISYDSLTKYLSINYTASQTTNQATITISFMGDGTYNADSWTSTLTLSQSQAPQSLNASPKSVSQEVSSFPITSEDAFLEINDANFTFDSSKWSATPNSASVSINSINYYSGTPSQLKVNYTVSQEVLSSSVTINFSGDGSYTSNSWLCSFEVKQTSTPAATLSWKQNPITINDSTSISGYVEYTGSGTLTYSSSNPNMYIDNAGFIHVPSSGLNERTYVTVSDGTLSDTVTVDYVPGKLSTTAGWYENGSQVNNLDLVIGSASDHTLTFQATPNDSWSFMDPMMSGISVNTTTGEITITGSNIMMNGNVTINANRMEDVNYYSGYSSLNINVYPAGTDLDFHFDVSSVSLDNQSMTTSNPYLINNTGIDTMMYPVTYSSGDTNIATVASNGTVSFVGAGTTTVTATLTNGNETHTATVTVYCSQMKQMTTQNWYENGNPLYNGLTLVEGAIDAHTLTFQATPNDSWSFSYNTLPTGITFDTTTGEISIASGAGATASEYYFSANRNEDSSYYMGYGSLNIRVLPAGTNPNFYYEMSSINLDNSAMQTSTPMLNNTTGIDTMMYPISYSSADTSVATVDNYGMITYVAPGTTTVTATISNGNDTYTATITVICSQMI